MLERFKLLLRDMNRGIYEKETEISLSLLAALAGESVILLGPPGVAKSMVARQLKCAFRGARNFEYLMSRFSTPDEIFGPVSIQKLKTSDTYERAVDGYLPTADVVFLDEIWKAGPAIQNTLLTVINEKLFRNGIREIELPLKLLVAASNELPAKGEGLEALWDRFVIRIESRPIRQEKNFREMLLKVKSEEQSSAAEGKANSNAITAEEYAEWSKAIDRIGVKEEVLDAISAIRKSLRAVNVDEAAEPSRVCERPSLEEHHAPASYLCLYAGSGGSGGMRSSSHLPLPVAGAGGEGCHPCARHQSTLCSSCRQVGRDEECPCRGHQISSHPPQS